MAIGRITKLNDLVQRRVCKALERGSTRTAAAGAAYITDRTLYEWMQRGREGEEPFAQFFLAVIAAESKAENTIADALFEQAASGHVQAQIAWLERRRAAGWAKREAPANTTNASDVLFAQGDADVSVIESVLEAAKSRKAGA